MSQPPDNLELVERRQTAEGETVAVFRLRGGTMLHETVLAEPEQEALARAAETLRVVEERRRSRLEAARMQAEASAGRAVAAPSNCRPCVSRKVKSLGFVSFVRGILSGAASPEVAARRLAICRACQAHDPDGSRLHRVIAGREYCGVPRLAEADKVYRDETAWGCGCELELKVTRAEVECPVGLW